MKQFIIFLLTFNTINAQFDVPLSLRAQFNGSYGYTIIGNTHNEFDNWQFPVPPCQMLTQSSATLNLLPSQNIVAAYLYWSGIGDGTLGTNIQLNGTNYNSSETLVGYPEGDLSFFSYFANYVDVTSQVIASGNGLYNFSNLDLNQLMPAYCSNSIYYGGWYMVIVYNQPSLPNQQINIYDGFNLVSTYVNNGVTPLTINNLNVIDNQNASISYVTWNGSPNLFFNENITFNGNILSNALNPPDNPFNGSNSFTGSTTNWNQDIDTFDVSPFISIGDTEANIIFNSVFYRLIQTIVTSIRSELPDATVQINQVSGQTLCNNRDLMVDYTVFNTNSNGVLPANVNVSFYADNVFIDTFTTPSSIIIGGNLPLQAAISIPAGIPDTFTLKVIVDNDAANISQVAESNENNNEASQIITLSAATIIPTFSIATSFCQNAIVPNLPLLSLNNISGTWLPSVINNQNNGSYIFTPNSGQCALNFTLNVTITPEILPTFTIANTFCQNATVPILPLTSNNGISGSWLSSVINNQSSGSYIFTPNSGQCANTFTLNVTITQEISPTFSIATSFCQNTTVPTLPTVSNNGISGSWSPNVINNQNNGSYIFSPNSGQCASNFTLNITITPEISPTFTIATVFCQNATVPTLPLTSNNGISGSWSPSVINNQTNGSYVFTPNAVQSNPAHQCALPFTLNISITPKDSPTFTQVPAICSGETLSSLPTTSLNGISGSWSPAMNNLQTTIYTFTPNAGQCANIAQFTIVVNQKIIPTFTQVPAICSGETFGSLPTTSLNGISGNWSPALNNLTTTTYTFTPNAGQCAENTQMTIIVNSSVISNFMDVSICEDDSSFSLPNSAPNGILGSWLPATLDVTATATYTFTPTNLQCATSQTITVTVNQSTLTDFDYVVSAPFANNATITVSAIAAGTYLYQLDNAAPQAENVFQNVTSGFHSITVIDENGCSNSITKSGILVLKYPNFFTPNGDGFNDTWNISDLFLQPSAKILIFDRYGKLLKQISPRGFGWDGTFDGRLMPADSYWFSVEYEYENSEQQFRAFFALKR